MNRLITFIFCFLTISLIGQQSSTGSRWVMTLSPLLQYPLVNIQENFRGEKLPVGKDWIQGYGIDLLKYFPNDKKFYTLQFKYAGRNAVINTFPTLFINENHLMVNSTINYSFSKKKPLFLDIDRFYIGAGMAYTFIPNGSLLYYSDGFIESSAELINRHRLEGILQFGFIEDVFNVSPLTSISKFNISVKFPFLRSANNFSVNFIDLEDEIMFLQKSNSFRMPLEIQYIHMFDTKKNSNQLDYAIKWTEGKWNAMIDPWKNYLPPFVNNTPPRKKFFGNFYFDYTLFRSQDSVLYTVDKTLYGVNQKFTSFALGYTFNFLGNYGKDYSVETPGIEIYSPVKKWRYNFFLGLGYKQQLLRGNNNWKHYDMFLPFAQGKLGIKVLNGNKKYSFVLGGSYQRLTSPQSFFGHIRTETPEIPNVAVFGGVGYKNHYIKIEMETKDFILNDINRSFNFVYSIGI